jgi:hypothetical protein
LNFSSLFCPVSLLYSEICMERNSTRPLNWVLYFQPVVRKTIAIPLWFPLYNLLPLKETMQPNQRQINM